MESTKGFGDVELKGEAWRNNLLNVDEEINWISKRTWVSVEFNEGGNDMMPFSFLLKEGFWFILSHNISDFLLFKLLFNIVTFDSMNSLAENI